MSRSAVGAAVLVLLAAACESVTYGVTSSSWLDNEHLLVAGPTFGVAKVACDGTIQQQWLRRADQITSVCALPGADRCLVESGRDHVSPHGYFGYEAPEMYSLDLRDQAMTRITNDEWEDRLLCRTGDVVWICRWRWLRAQSGLLEAPREIELVQFNFVTGAWTKTADLNESDAVRSGTGLPDASGVIAWPSLKFSAEGEQISNDYPWETQTQREGFRVLSVSSSDRAKYSWFYNVEGTDLSTGVTRTIYRGGEFWNINNLQISPDGKFLSFIESNASSASPICIVELESQHLVKVLVEPSYERH